jgi:hypothetical protein
MGAMGCTFPNEECAGLCRKPPPQLGNYLLHIAPAAAQIPFKTTKMKEYINFAGHSKGHGNAPVLYLAHHPMEEF